MLDAPRARTMSSQNSFLIENFSPATKIPRSRLIKTRLGALVRALGRPALASAAILGLGYGLVASDPVSTVEPGELVLRSNQLLGSTSEIPAGWFFSLPALHRVRRFPLRDLVYHPASSVSATGASPYQSLEGLSFGLELNVRYALDPSAIPRLRVAPERIGPELVEPITDGLVRRVLSKHTVREVFSSQRLEVETEITTLLAPLLKEDGVVLKGVFIGNVDLPQEYRAGLESLLAEELASEKMRFTLELKDKEVKQSELEGEAQKVRSAKQAEALGQAEVIAAKARAEAMQHVLPFKEKEIQQRRLEAEATKVARIMAAEGDAEARRIEAGGEADSRRKLADSEAYRTQVVAKAQSEALARDSVLIAQNPLLIQKTLADKLSDKISVIIAPPQAGGFFADRLIGTTQAAKPQAAVARGPAQRGMETDDAQAAVEEDY